MPLEVQVLLGFFPTPYPDELLYSILARYHIRSGNFSPKATLFDLFGSTSVSSVVDLPGHLDALVDNMPPGSVFSAESILFNHTLFPFYAPFLPPERASEILSCMKGSSGGSIHGKAGIMASNFEIPRFLRFCPTCFLEDTEIYGEPYWHRLHQVPGVLVCQKHLTVLTDSTVRVSGYKKHEFHAPNEINCTISPQKISYTGEVLEKLCLIAEDVEFLLKNRLSSLSPFELQERYLSLLIDKDLATPTGRVRQRDLSTGFLNYYGNELLNLLQSPVNKSSDSWLNNIVRKHRKAFHPIRHLLLLRFLSTPIEYFFAKSSEYKPLPFGEAPWPCLNAGSNHYKENTVYKCDITRCCDTKKPVGTFYCSCGFIYSRRGPDREINDRYKIGRIKSFGKEWEARLRYLVEEEKLSMRETARRLRVDANTVKKYALNLGLKHSWKLSTSFQAISNKESPGNKEPSSLRDKYRANWLNAQILYPEFKKTQLRSLLPKEYAWLYCHDRNWLDFNSPVTEKKRYVDKRVNWEERDKKILKDAAEVVNSLKTSAGKPIRITISRVAKEIGVLSIVEKHLDKLSLTKKFLEKSVETIEDYQARRVTWAAREIFNAGEEVKSWKIMRKAGLRPNCSPKVKAAIIKQVNIFEALSSEAKKIL